MRNPVQAIVGLGLLLVVQGAVAQTPEAGPAVTGYLYDAHAQGLKAILGVPGSAFLSENLVGDLDGAWASPDRNHAIAVRGEETFLFRGLRSLRPAEVGGIRLLSRPTRVVWSFTGQTAALYDAVQGTLQIVRIAGESVTAEAPVTVVADAQQETTALAITDSGNVALTAGGSVYSITQTGIRQQWTAKTASLAYCRQDRLYAVVSEQLVELLPYDDLRSVATTEDGISSVACAGERLLAVSAREPAALLYGTDGALLQKLPLERVPSVLLPMRPGSVFLLNGVEGQHRPPLILDLTGEPTVFFIPAGDASAW